ncbi:hypothetical protein LC612_39090 [Nostoc sp. CHAB 5834]|nr:hypothetical protein [Nostoc sp. CHAB 5834]
MSYNIKCFATNQTISEDNPCRVVPIIQAEDYRPKEIVFRGTRHQVKAPFATNTALDSYWVPLTGLISGHYRDSGFVELELDAFSRTLVLHFLDQLVTNGCQIEGEGKQEFDFQAFVSSNAPLVAETLKRKDEDSPDGPSDAAELDAQIRSCWAYVWMAARSNNVFVMSIHGSIRTLSFATMHELAYKQLLNEPPVEHIADRRATWTLKSRVQTALSDMAPAPTNTGDHADLLRKFFRHSNFLRHFAPTDFSEARVISSVIRVALHHELVEALDKPEPLKGLVELLAPVMDQYLVLASLNGLNVKLGPWVYAGQDYFNSLGKDYNRLCDAAGKAVEDAQEALHADF